MADEENKNTEESGEAKKSPMKTMIVVAAIMVVEAVVVFGLAMMTSGGPSEASAEQLEGQALADEERLVEIELIKGAFQNRNSGRPWHWQVELFLQARNKNVEFVEKTLEERNAEISEGIRLIISKAQDRHLKEPGTETVKRQITAYIHKIFGADPDGEARVERVIISKFDGFPAD